MKIKNNILKKITSIWIVLSLVFIFPINFGIIFASSNSNPGTIVSKQEVGSVCGGGYYDVKDSLLLSIVTMCIPGILEKTNDWKEIKCQATTCYYDAVKNGLDPTFCIKQSSYQTCNYIIGDVFAIPGLDVFDNVRQIIADALANPIGTIISVTKITTRIYIDSTCTINCPAYNIPASLFLNVIDSASLIEQIKEIFTQGFFPPLTTKSSCDRLPQIKKEMDKILKYS